MIYLSLDQAMKTTGYAVWENDKLIVADHFSIPAYKPIEQRLQALIQKLNEIANTYGVQEIFFEDIQYQNNAETYKKLAYVQAAIIIWCYNNNYKFSILKPSHWRKVLGERFRLKFSRARAEQKRVALEHVTNFYGIEATEDEADAICLGQAALIEKLGKQSAF